MGLGKTSQIKLGILSLIIITLLSVFVLANFTFIANAQNNAFVMHKQTIVCGVQETLGFFACKRTNDINMNIWFSEHNTDKETYSQGERVSFLVFPNDADSSFEFYPEVISNE